VTVHIWKRETYIGQVVTTKNHEIAVEAQNANAGAEIRQVVLGGSADFVEFVKVGTDERRTLEFPTDEWLGVRCLMLLPEQGYRVHVIIDAKT
jgi:hypothetical protein